MNIQEFRSRFVSRKEKSLLFDALRRLSRRTELKTLIMGNYSWAEWPSGDGPGEHALTGRL